MHYSSALARPARSCWLRASHRTCLGFTERSGLISGKFPKKILTLHVYVAYML